MRRALGIIAAVAVVVGLGIAAQWWPSATRQDGTPSLTGERFPEIDRATLTPRQVRVIDVVQQQFDAQPPGKTYSENVEEPWCADFVSWVLREAGAPLSNPNGGSWRIPGVYTMAEYFQSVGRLEKVGYQPHPGDVTLWGTGSPMGLHANIVIAASGDTITTVGGNEGGIHIRQTQIRPDTGLLGFGRLN